MGRQTVSKVVNYVVPTPPPDGNVYVVPAALVDDWIAGRQELDSCEEWQLVIRGILAEWRDGR